MQLIGEFRATDTISGGSLNVDFGFGLGVIIKQIIVTLSGSTTLFDITILDSKSDIVYKRTDEVGCLNELLELPAKDNYTLQITNALANDSVVVKIIYHEN